MRSSRPRTPRSTRRNAPARTGPSARRGASPAAARCTASREGSSLNGTGMGLLDDAIREHLELKRQHGGDPSEIEAQEREAFGPRQAAARDAAPGAEAPPGGLDDSTRLMPAPAEAQEPESAEGAAPDAPPDEVPDDEVPTDEAQADRTAREEDPWLADEPEPEAEPEEDVLEETPDFLQETPEHDRLWFEQKPPRDFDWDK